ncbi:MAG: 1,4-dihydroxy-6-naphthoate synthase [Deltaproteobacteria bacterium]|nr:1,4-dihydroxy-6-naphthoate synthase [Deltaproteobacteria bacterium]
MVRKRGPGFRRYGGQIYPDKDIHVAFSSCPNDTFMFHAMLNNLVNTAGLSFTVCIDDVESLNRQAKKETHQVTKLSFAAWLRLKDKYDLLDSGAALGFGCGPLLVAGSKNLPVEEALVAVPGIDTTANMLFDLRYPGAKNKKAVRFDEILPGIRDGKFDAGVIIHEGRFVFQDYGCVQIIDLGRWWEEETGLPIPLGCIAIRRDMETMAHKNRIESIIRDSVKYAFENPLASRGYVRSLAREMDDDVIDEHIRLYVNEFTLRLGEKGREAVQKLEEMSRCRIL